MSLRFTHGFGHMAAIGDFSKTSVGRVVGRKAFLKWVQEGMGICYGSCRKQTTTPISCMQVHGKLKQLHKNKATNGTGMS